MNSSTQANDSRVRRLVARVARARGFLLAGASVAAALGSPGPAGAIPPTAPEPGAYVTNGPVGAIAYAAGRTYIGGEFTRVGRRTGSGVTLSSGGAAQAFPEVAGGNVHAAISDGDGGWYLGGTFTSVVGQPHVGLAHIKSDGSVDSGFNPAVRNADGSPATVNALVLSPPTAEGARTLYVGGRFTRVGVQDTQIHHNVAALEAGSGEPLAEFGLATGCSVAQQPGCSPAVHALELTNLDLPVGAETKPQPVLFVGGSFTAVGPSDAPAVTEGAAAAWGVGSVDGSGLSNGGALVRNAGGAAPWSPDLSNVPATSPPSSAVFSLEAGPPDSTADGAWALAVYVAGQNQNGGPPFNPMARAFQFKLNKSSRELTFFGAPPEFGNWKPQPGGCTQCAVRAMALDGPTLYFGGDFTQVGAAAVPASRLAMIERVTNPNVTPGANKVPSALGAGVDGPVRALTRPAGNPTTLLAAGSFTSHIAAFDTASGAVAPAWTSPQPDASVHTLASDSSTTSIYAGGEFRSLNSVPRAGLAAFDTSGALLDWAPGIVSDDRPLVHALAASDTRVYVGGRFDAVTDPGGSHPHANLAAIGAADGKPIDAFDPGPALTGGHADVLTLSLLGPTLYVGGVFDEIDAEKRDNLAAVDATSGTVAPWNPRAQGVDPVVRAVLPACGAVFVGGRFDEVGGQPRNNLAAIDPGTGAATSWNPDPNGSVLALARSGATIYAGGNFASIGQRPRQKVAALDAVQGIADPSFDAGINAQIIGGASVRALAVSDSALYLGGRFLNIRGEPRGSLAAVDPATGAANGWDPSADGQVDALAAGGGGVYAGGKFESLGTTAQRGFAAFGSGAGFPFAESPCVSTTESVQPGSGAPGPLASADGPTPPVASSRGTSSSSLELMSAVTVSPSRVRLGGSPVTLRFRLSRATRLELRFERRAARRCPARRSTASGRRRTCVGYVPFAKVARRARRGLNRISFPHQRIGRRKLVPGRYRVRLAPLPARGARLQRLAYFRVVSG